LRVALVEGGALDQGHGPLGMPRRHPSGEATIVPELDADADTRLVLRVELIGEGGAEPGLLRQHDLDHARIGDDRDGAAAGARRLQPVARPIVGDMRQRDRQTLLEMRRIEIRPVFVVDLEGGNAEPERRLVGEAQVGEALLTRRSASATRKRARDGRQHDQS
jgi:hypothetical protein